MQEDAEAVRRAFFATRSSFIPGSKTAGGKPDVFLRAAILARKYGVEPAAYATLMVTRAFEKGFPVFPNILLSKGLYVDSGCKTASGADTSVRYSIQLDKFRTLRNSFTIEQLLSDTVLDFSPLFRYVMGAHHGLPAVMAAYREGAKAELLAYPVARQIFSDQLGSL